MVRVYKYGCLAPIVGADLVEDQMRLAARYFNRLIEVKRAQHAAYRQAERDASPELESLEEQATALEARREALEADIRRHRQTTRSRTVPKDLVAARKDLGAQMKALRAERKLARAMLRDDPQFRAAKADQHQRWLDMRRSLRAASGLRHGTYTMVESRVDQAVSDAMKRGQPPRFRRYDGEGAIGVQIQGGIAVPGIGSHTFLQIDPVPPGCPGMSRRQRLAPHTCIRIRVGTGEKRAPIWAEFPMTLHRPLPTDGIVKTASVQRRRVGTRWRWEALIIIDSPEREQALSGRGVAAVNFGWRQRPNGVRVGMVATTSGTEEIVVPGHVFDAIDHAASIRSIQDREFDAIRAMVISWRDAGRLSEWLQEAARNIGQWRSPRRLIRVAMDWRSHRFDGDDELFDAVEVWRRQDRHLYQWWSSELDKARRRRRQFFREEAKRLVEMLAEIRVDASDLASMKTRHMPGIDNELGQKARRNLHEAAPGEFREMLIYAAQKRGVHVVKIKPSKGASFAASCHVCGGECSWDRAEDLHHGCEHCGAVWDQDENAARNLLAFGSSEMAAK